MKRLALSCVLLAAACFPTFTAALEVAAGIPPVAYVVERIGGKQVRVETLIRPGQDPHAFEPTPKQMRALGRTALFFKVGLPFEEQILERLLAQRPDLPVVDTARGIRRLPLASVRLGDHSADNTKHDAVDPHVWLSPLNVKRQAAQVAAALQKIDPQHADLYRSNLFKLHADLDAAHAKNLKRLKPFAGRTFYVFHPAFAYFAECYGLKQAAIETGGKPPSAKQLRAIVHRAKSDAAKVLFLQPQFSPRSAQAVAEVLGAEVVPLNHLEKDVLVNFEDLGKKIEGALSPTLLK